MGQAVKKAQDERSYLCDRFNPPQALVASPRWARPGVAESWIVTQADGAMSITNDGLAFTAQASPTWGDLSLVSNTTYARSLNTGFFVDCSLTSGSVIVGLFSAQAASLANLQHGIRVDADRLSICRGMDDPALTSLTIVDAINRLSIGVVPRSGGGAYYLLHESTDSWLLLGADSNNSGGSNYVGISSYDAVGSFRAAVAPDCVFDLSPEVTQEAVSYGTEYGSVEHKLLDVLVTLPGSLVNGHTLDIKAEYQDANNWAGVRVRIDGGIVKFALYEVASGSGATFSNEIESTLAANGVAGVQVRSYAGFVLMSIREGASPSEWYVTQAELMSNPPTGETSVVISRTGTLAASNLSIWSVRRPEISDRLLTK